MYGENVNSVPLEERETRWAFRGDHAAGIAEGFSIDLCAHTPYGCSKLTGDLYMQDYARLYGVKTGVFRMSCIFGTRQFAMEDQGWVAWFTIAALTGKQITVFGDGKQERDFTFVEDIARGTIAATKPLGYELVNLGNDQPSVLMDVINMIEDMVEKKANITHEPMHAADVRATWANIDRAKNLLGWQPQVPIEEGLKRTVDWYMENRDWAKNVKVG